MRDGKGGPMLCVGVSEPLREGATYFASLTVEDALLSVLDVEIVDLPPPQPEAVPVPLVVSKGVAVFEAPEAAPVAPPAPRRRRSRRRQKAVD